MTSGTAYAERGEASAPEVRKLWWDLSPEQRALADQIMTDEAEEMRGLPAERLEKQIQAVENLLATFDRRRAAGDDEEAQQEDGPH